MLKNTCFSFYCDKGYAYVFFKLIIADGGAS